MGNLPIHLVARAVREALLEDIGPSDLTTESVVPPGTRARASITAGTDLVVAGIEAATLCFLCLDPLARFPCTAPPGATIAAGGIILSVEAEAAAILAAERTALNFLGRLCGIATLTRRCVALVQGTRASIYDTRKTTPGLRLLERNAVAMGGGRNHRFGLHDAILIKDNHLRLAGGVEAAVTAARARHPQSRGSRPVIEVEIDRLEDLAAAIDAGADIVLLDNMTPAQVGMAVSAAAGRIVLEASGGITFSNLTDFAATGVDRISLGALTHSAPASDVGLWIEPITSDG